MIKANRNIQTTPNLSRNIITFVSSSCKWKLDIFLFLFVSVIVFLSRDPFLNAGYGIDPDAWRIAITARNIATSVEYSASRLPGYPIQEIVCSLIWKGGPFALNGATAFLSSLGVGFFALSLKTLGYKNYICASLALAFTPVIFKNSTNSMDYMWALAFILASLYYILVKKSLIAGIFLGMAIGCRITSGAMIIPLSLLLVQGGRKYNVWHIARFSLATCFVGTAAFVPVFLKYGWGFLTFCEYNYPSAITIFRTSTDEVWGKLGLVAILTAVIPSIFKRITRSNAPMPTPVSRLQIIAWVLIICIYLFAFIRLPSESGYLIPIVPFVILLLGSFLTQKCFIFVCIALICSPFISICRSGICSPIFVEHSTRIEKMKYIEQILLRANGVSGKNIIIAGTWLPQIREAQIRKKLFLDPQETLKFVELIDVTQLQKYIEQGFKIYYLNNQREYNLGVKKFDLLENGAVPFDFVQQDKPFSY